MLLAVAWLAGCSGEEIPVAEAPAADATPVNGVNWMFGSLDVDSGQKFEVDATLNEPDTDVGTITKYVAPRDPQATLDRLVTLFAGDAQLYADDGRDPASLVERVIGEYEAARALTQAERDARYRWDDGTSITDEQLDSWIDDYKSRILAEATFPDGAAREIATSQMTWDSDDECNVLSVYAHPTARSEDDILFFSVNGDGFHARIRDAGEEGAIAPLLGNARQTAERVIADMGLTDMTELWVTEHSKATNDPLETAEVTRLTYAQAVPCVAPMAYANLCQNDFAGNYVSIDVGRGGVTNLYMSHCMEKAGEPARTAPLRPLDEAMQDELMGTLWYFGNYADTVASVSVTRAEYGYAAVAPAEDGYDPARPYWLVPVWRFYGEIEFVGEPDESLLKNYLPYQREAYLSDSASHPLCLATVLAIDPSALPDWGAGG